MKAVKLRCSMLLACAFICGACAGPRAYNFSCIDPSRSARLSITTDSLVKTNWYLLTKYSLSFFVFHVEPEHSDKMLYMGRVKIEEESPHVVIQIPSDVKMIFRASFTKNRFGQSSGCNPTTELMANAGAYYELLFHEEEGVCSLHVVSADRSNIDEKSEMKAY